MLSYAEVIRLFSDRGIDRRETEDGGVYFSDGTREIPIPADTPLAAWVTLAAEFFGLDIALDLRGDPSDDD